MQGLRPARTIHYKFSSTVGKKTLSGISKLAKMTRIEIETMQLVE